MSKYKYHIEYYCGRWLRIVWYNKDGRYHNSDDMPALIYLDSSESYYKNGQWHRDDGPAIIHIENGMISLKWYHDNIRYTPKCTKL